MRALPWILVISFLARRLPADADCNGNGIADWEDVTQGSANCDQNIVPDECQLVPVDRGFVQAGSHPSTAPLEAVELGDLDGDGDLDVAALARFENRLVVLVNDGRGNLGGFLEFRTGPMPRDLILADLDGDLDLDAATANELGASVLRGDGAAAFALDAAFIVGSGPRAIAAGDFDLDGDQDLVTLNDPDESRSPGSISLFWNRGGGAFDEPRNFAAAVDPARLVTADIDRDGDLDLIVSSLRFTDGKWTTLRNEGGTFVVWKEEEVNGGWQDAIVIADLIEDEAPDVFSVNNHLGRLIIWSGNESGDYSRGYTYWKIPHVLGAVDLDLDGDGDLDVAFAAADSSTLIVFRNDRTHFTQSRRMPVRFPPSAMAAGDLDGDGAPDLVLATTRGIDVLMNSPGDYGPDCNGNGLVDVCEPGDDCNGNGSPDSCDVAHGLSKDCDSDGAPDECGTPDCNGNRSPDACDVAGGSSKDCNANGIPDECEVDCNRNRIPDTCDTSSGTSADCNADSVPDECEVAAGDCNGNGLPDDCDVTSGRSHDCNSNVVPDECDLVSVFHLEPVLHEIVSQPSWPLVRAADLDLDGLQDLVIADWTVQTLLNTGDGSFRKAYEEAIGTGPSSAIVEDLDLDGDTDAALGLVTGVTLLRNDGRGVFSREALSSEGDAVSVAAADLDGDQDPDLVSVSNYSVDLLVFLADGSGGFTPGPPLQVGLGPAGLAAADLDGDGTTDLVTSARMADSAPRQVVFLFGGGAAGLTRMVGPAAPGFVRAFAAGDLDSDGRNDVAVSANVCPIFCAGEVQILGNVTGRAFTTRATFGSRFESYDVALEDIDGDGQRDLVTLETSFFNFDDISGSNIGRTASIRLNDGAGTLGPRLDYAMPYQPGSIAVTDLGGSDLPEIAIGARARLHILWNHTGPYSLDGDRDGLPDECRHAAFDRCDANADGVFGITDPITVLLFLVAGGEAPGCLKAADCDDGGTLDITDAIRGLLYLFAGGDTIPPPFEGCGRDRTEDALSCEAFSPCA